MPDDHGPHGHRPHGHRPHGHAAIDRTPGTDATTATAGVSAGRRTMLRAGAAIGVSATLGVAGAVRAGAASAAETIAKPAAHPTRLPYPDVADTSHATERVARIVKAFFTAKSLHQGAEMVSFFAPAPAPAPRRACSTWPGTPEATAKCKVALGNLSDSPRSGLK